MSETEPTNIIEVTPEDLERVEELRDSMTDTLENIGDFVSPGDKFPIHPASFEEAAALEEELGEDKLKACLVVLAKQILGFPKKAGTLFSHKENGTQWGPTKFKKVYLATDGTDWWVEHEPDLSSKTKIAPAKEGKVDKKAAIISAKVKKVTG